VAAGFGSTRNANPVSVPVLVATPDASADAANPADPAARTSKDQAPPGLAGFTVAVATERRNHEIAGLLEASGARTIGARAVRTISQPDPIAIAHAVRMSVAEPVHEVIVSSAFGLRAWFDAARRTGHFEALLSCFGEARLLARDARTADGIRELGLTQIWSTAAGTVEDLFRYLIAQPMIGRRVVAHIESDAHRELCHALRAAGATVVEVATAQFGPPPDVYVVRRIVDLVVRRQVDAILLAGPTVTENLVDQASSDGSMDEMLNALVEGVLAVCLGPLTAAPLVARGVPVVQAAEPLPASLAASAVTELPRRAIVVEAAGRRIEIRGQAVVIAGQLLPVQPGPLSVLRALAIRPGRLLSAAEIRALIPHSPPIDDHAIEMAVSRLRGSLSDSALDGRELVQTVMKRGYRLAL
jgi:uroporphyrinogen-III synthase